MNTESKMPGRTGKVMHAPRPDSSDLSSALIHYHTSKQRGRNCSSSIGSLIASSPTESFLALTPGCIGPRNAAEDLETDSGFMWHVKTLNRYNPELVVVQGTENSSVRITASEEKRRLIPIRQTNIHLLLEPVRMLKLVFHIYQKTDNSTSHK